MFVANHLAVSPVRSVVYNGYKWILNTIKKQLILTLYPRFILCGDSYLKIGLEMVELRQAILSKKRQFYCTHGIPKTLQVTG